MCATWYLPVIEAPLMWERQRNRAGGDWTVQEGPHGSARQQQQQGLNKNRTWRTSLVVQWLRCYDSTAGVHRPTPGQGTKIFYLLKCRKKKKNRDSKTTLPDCLNLSSGFPYPPPCCVTWVPQFTSLCFTFLIWKMRKRIVFSLQCCWKDLLRKSTWSAHLCAWHIVSAQ